MVAAPFDSEIHLLCGLRGHAEGTPVNLNPKLGAFASFSTLQAPALSGARHGNMHLAPPLGPSLGFRV